MNIKIKLISTLICLILAAGVTAQIDSENFSELIGSEPTVEINLGPMMLNLLSSATQDEEQGISSILSSLKAINVTVFEIEKSKKIDSIRAEIKNMAKLKTAAGFEKIATVKEDDSLVYIFAKMDQKNFKSLSIFALDDDDELVLIDIQGSILMSQIGNLMEHFDVDLELNSLEINKQRKK